ncbi:MAG: ribonuclease P protein component [Magnetococcus sp. WYHC-3]
MPGAGDHDGRDGILVPAGGATASRHAFPREARLLRSREFQYVTSRGLRRQWPLLLAFIAANDQGQWRLGLTVSRKVGKAHERNRIKRLARESFRIWRGQQRPLAAGDQAAMPGTPGSAGEGVDIVLIARPSARLAVNAELTESFLQVFRQAQRLTLQGGVSQRSS